MATDFSHAVLRVHGAATGDVVTAIRHVDPWLALAGARGIGWASDEFAVIIADDAGDTGGGRALDDLARRHQWELRDPLLLTATVRPVDASPPEVPGGIVALRRFEVAEGNTAEFVELSHGAWPAFEQLYNTRVLGLFRTRDDTAGIAEFLLATWYASLAEWEHSRGVGGADGGTDAGQRFVRRREITVRTVVRVGVPI